MPHFPPPPPLPKKTRRFQRVPPAIFPPILGLFGLGMAWRRGVGAFGLPEALAELLLGAVSLLFLFAIGCYAVKFRQRPGVVPEDLATVPGRTGLAAMTMCVMLLGAVLLPYGPALAQACLWAGLAGHLGIIAMVSRTLLTSPPEGRRLTPAMHLVYSGVIVAPIALIPMGYSGLAGWISWYVVLAMAAVTLPTLPGLVTGSAPAPLRPLQSIHLAPPALGATAAFGTGQDMLALVLLGWASLLTLVLMLRARWMTEAGFSGFWSAFTFPVAAFAGAWFAASTVFGSGFAEGLGGVVLILATLIIPPIAVKVMKAWADGTLAAKTNAALA